MPSDCLHACACACTKIEYVLETEEERKLRLQKESDEKKALMECEKKAKLARIKILKNEIKEIEEEIKGT